MMMYWILTALSFGHFWLIIPYVFVRFYLGFDILFKSLRVMNDFRENHYIPEMEKQVSDYLIVYNLWHLLFGVISTIVEPFGPWGFLTNLAISIGVWVYIDIMS